MRKSVLLFFLLVTSLGYGEIVETKSFNEIKCYLAPDTLVIFDIDDTLLIPVQMLGSDEWFKTRIRHYQKIGLSPQEGLEKSLAEWEAVRHLTKMEIVEPGSEKIVRNLQNQCYTVMGLTTQGLALATRTKQQLNEIQIDLTRTAPGKHDYYFELSDHGILYRAGILYTSGRDKGKALFQLLGQLNYMPKRIVFINDKRSHLLQVEKHAKERGVEFYGLRYAYSDARKAKFNERIADYQFNNSTFTHILTDEEAEKQLMPKENVAFVE